MKILSIDTASDVCSVAILDDNTVIKEISVKDGYTHSVKLMPQIKQAFKDTNLSLGDIDLFACDKGPGSFTGIRIGISTIKAFCDVTCKPCVGISSLLGLAYNVKNNGYICSLIDAKNDNVYYSLFENANGKYVQIGEYLSDNINYITNILKNCNKPISFVGNGSIVYKDVLKSVLKENANFTCDMHSNDLNAINIGTAAFNIFKNDEVCNYPLSALYLKKSSAEIILEEKNANKNN